jgi:hypothetical protein
VKKSLPRSGRRRSITCSPVVNGSSRFAERVLEACLQGANRVRRNLLGQTRQLLSLLSESFELLARVRGRQFQELGWRLHANELTGKIESGVGVGADHLDPLQIEVGCALGDRGVCLLHQPVGLSGGGFRRFIHVLAIGRTLLRKLPHPWGGTFNSSVADDWMWLLSCCIAMVEG